jgi:starch phosphorylase
LRLAVDLIASDAFAPGQPGLFRPIVDELTGRDRYFLCADFHDYAEAQARAAATYAKPDEWWRRSILNVAGMGPFSSDRTTRQYAEEIWTARPVAVPTAR